MGKKWPKTGGEGFTFVIIRISEFGKKKGGVYQGVFGMKGTVFYFNKHLSWVIHI